MQEPNFVHDSQVELIGFMGGDDSVVRSATVSFNNDNKEISEERRKGLIRFLYNNRHSTPFEHSVFTFHVNTPIFVAREFHRHRTASYSELSMRYATPENMEFYIPPADRPLIQQGKAGDYYFVGGSYDQQRLVEGDIKRETRRALDAYNRMLDAGVAREVARQALPQNFMTRFYATMNARNLMHFLGLRNDPTALYEIRRVAEKMEVFLEEKMPVTYEAYKETA